MTRIFYASDIHGSEKCFKKFLNAADFYKAETLIMGGDLTGKLIIPIIQNNGKFEFSLAGVRHVTDKEEKLKEFEQQIKNSGYYPYRTTPEEVAELDASKEKRDELFSTLMFESVKGWISLAEQKLRGKGIKCFINPGNDDRFLIDPLLKSSDVVVMPEGEVVKLDDSHEMISMGFANKTPWNCPRDIEEEQLHEKIENMAARVRDMRNCVFNFHVPPYDSKIDEAPKLDEKMTPLRSPGGDFVLEPVGSRAVRDAIEKYQPLLGLHGHIHEGKGWRKLGRTLVLNSGSEYSEGILHGIIVRLDEDKVNYQFTTG